MATQDAPDPGQAPPPAPTRSTLPLFSLYPALQDEVPWTSLTEYPSPTRRLKRSGNALGHPHLWIKRDDMLGSAYGGNKIRKLEFILADARRQSSEDLITVGGIGSHHVLASAIYARQLGMKVTAVLFPQPVTPHVRDVLLALFSLGVDCRLCRNRVFLLPQVLWEYTRRRFVRVTKSPYVIGPGGSSILGSLGYVNAALELKQQIDRGDVALPATIYIPLGSGGTMAGLLIGLALAGLPTRVVGVRVVEGLVCNRYIVASLAEKVLQLLRRADPALNKVKIPPDQIHIDAEQLGRGYGWPTEGGEKAVQFMKDNERILLETTYTGKAFAAFMDHAPSEKRVPILFWNTFNSKPVHSMIRARVKDLPADFRALLKGF